MVHRLDYDTSGIVLLPLHKKALSELSKQFQARTIIKQYQALVAGEISAAGDIDLPIAADPAGGLYIKFVPNRAKRHSRTISG